MAFLGFGGSSTPTFNTAPLQQQIDQSAQRRKSLVAGLASGLQGANNQYSTAQGTAGTNFTAANDAATKAYQTGLAGLGAESDAANKEALRSGTEQAYRNVPQQQEAIREALGGTGQLRTGAAGAAVAKPLIQASQSIADLTSQLTQKGLNQADARREAGVNALYASAEGNALTQLGIDQQTASTLLSTGRADLIQQAAQLAGIDTDTLNATLGLNITAQEGNIANAQAGNANRAAMIKALGGLGGAAVGGAMGGLPGANAGAGIGGNVGSILAGFN